MSTGDDERWIEDRRAHAKEAGQFAWETSDMRAALARGRAQGHADVAQLKAHVAAAERARDTFQADADSFAADRDRLAKRCEELLATGEMYRAETERLEIQLGRTCAALPNARLAALEQRVGALVEALSACFGGGGLGSYTALADRLAALRSPGVGADDRCRRATQRLVEIAGADGPMSLEDAIEWAGGKVEALESALATSRREEARLVELLAKQHEEAVRAAADASTTRRERDEAVGILRAWVDWRDKHGLKDDQLLESALWPTIASARALVDPQGAPDTCPRCRHRAHDPGDCWNQESDNGCECRSLVAGEAGPDPRDAEVAGLRKALVDKFEEITAAHRAYDDATGNRGESGGSIALRVRKLCSDLATLRTSLAEAQGEVAAMHAADSIAVTEARAEIATLRTRLDKAGKLIEVVLTEGESAIRCGCTDPGLCRGCRAHLGEALAGLRAWGK